jgi:uroporphyrinogen-III synthase
MATALTGRRIVLPETRELDLFARMLEERGGEVVRCPMIAIRDAPERAPIEGWLRRVIGGGADDLVLMTGEGLRRLRGVASRAGIETDFVAALQRLRKTTRGPKPVRALREIGLDADLQAEAPTTEGVIATLATLALKGRRFAVQLYPESPMTLVDFLVAAGASVDPIIPYVYASAAEDQQVLEAIERMAEGEVDVIAFTSSPQVRRLEDVARSYQREARLAAAFRRTKVASVGPVVTEALQRIGVAPAITTDGAFFMKPLVNKIVAAIGRVEPS